VRYLIVIGQSRYLEKVHARAQSDQLVFDLNGDDSTIRETDLVRCDKVDHLIPILSPGPIEVSRIRAKGA
jgi:hypothetical protein